jgi:hypothetical protein
MRKLELNERFRCDGSADLLGAIAAAVGDGSAHVSAAAAKQESTMRGRTRQ